MTPFEILPLASVADVKLFRKPDLNIYKIGFMLKKWSKALYFLTFFTLKTEFLYDFYSPQA